MESWAIDIDSKFPWSVLRSYAGSGREILRRKRMELDVSKLDWRYVITQILVYWGYEVRHRRSLNLDDIVLIFLQDGMKAESSK